MRAHSRLASWRAGFGRPAGRLHGGLTVLARSRRAVHSGPPAHAACLPACSRPPPAHTHRLPAPQAASLMWSSSRRTRLAPLTGASRCSTTPPPACLPSTTSSPARRPCARCCTTWPRTCATVRCWVDGWVDGLQGVGCRWCEALVCSAAGSPRSSAAQLPGRGAGPPAGWGAGAGAEGALLWALQGALWAAAAAVGCAGDGPGWGGTGSPICACQRRLLPLASSPAADLLARRWPPRRRLLHRHRAGRQASAGAAQQPAAAHLAHADPHQALAGARLAR